MAEQKLSDQEVVDYIESSATLIENLKSEVKKLASEKDILEKNLDAAKKDAQSYKAALYKKAGEKHIEKIYLSKEQADLIANNLVNVQLVKSASINEVSEILQKDTSKMVQVVNGLIAKLASVNVSNFSRGRGIAPEKDLTKTLSEEELIEKSAFYSKH